MSRSNETSAQFLPDHFPLLFLGEEREYSFRFEGHWRTQRVDAQPFTAIDNQGQTMIGIGRIDLRTRSINSFDSTILHEPADIPGAFHACLIMGGLRVIREGTLHQIEHLVNRHPCCNQEEHDAIVEDIGSAELAAILSRPSADLPAILDLFDQEEVDINPRVFEREILAEAMDFSLELQLRNVRPPDVIKARRSKAQELLRPYETHVEEILTRVLADHPDHEELRPKLRRRLRKNILEAMCLGLEEPQMVLGFACIPALERLVILNHPIFQIMMGTDDDLTVRAFQYLAEAFPLKPSAKDWPGLLMEVIANRVSWSEAINRRTCAAQAQKLDAEVRYRKRRDFPKVDLEAEL